MSRAVTTALYPALPLLCLYYAAGVGGLSLAQVNASASAVWAPTGIAIAALLVHGRRLWPVILAGAFLVNITTGAGIVGAILIATGNTLEAVIGAALVERFAGGRRAFEHVADTVAFSVLIVGAATLVSASMGAVALLLTPSSSARGPLAARSRR
jgi:integral membrane sensor domain MASE1